MHKCDDCKKRTATTYYLRKAKDGQFTSTIRLKLCGYCNRRHERLEQRKQTS